MDLLGLLVTLLVGALIGWIASLMMRTNAEQGIFMNVVVGLVGAALGRWLFGSVLGIGSATAAGQFDLAGLLWGVLGAVVLLGILRVLNVVRQ